MNEVNLQNPIFVYYVSVEGMTRQNAEDQIAMAKELFTYDNITTWIVPIQRGDTRIEIIYHGRE